MGIGLIKHLPYILGTLPVLKRTLNREWRNNTELSFFSTSIGIPSTSHALPNVASSMALFTSIIEMLALNIGTELSSVSCVFPSLTIFVSKSILYRLWKTVFYLLSTVLIRYVFIINTSSIGHMVRMT